MKPVVGFVGIGAMGSSMTRNLLKGGYQLVVYDIKKEAVAALAGEGAETATSPREVASRCPVVITMLPASPDVEMVVLGKDGVAEGAKPGNILIDMSSSYPTSTRMISEKLVAGGLRMLDAPVSGGTKGAREGTLSIMVGGVEKDYQECHPIFEAMGKNIYYVGGIGSGHIIKALNNMCSATTLAITAEAVTVATKLGVDPQKVTEVINTSSGRSYSSQFKFVNYVLNGAYNSGFTLNLMNKDVGMALRLGQELHIPMMVGAVVQQLHSLAVNKGLGAECHAAIAKLQEEWAGVKISGVAGK
jgi:3-hydroxyisobutyrate dehydrogenase